jgi:hypothetical protein
VNASSWFTEAALLRLLVIGLEILAWRSSSAFGGWFEGGAGAFRSAGRSRHASEPHEGDRPASDPSGSVLCCLYGIRLISWSKSNAHPIISRSQTRGNRTEVPMLDAAYILIGAVFLGACVLYAFACNRM